MGRGPGQSDKKSSDNVFLALSLSYRGQITNFKEIYHFSMFQRPSNIFQGGGGPTFSSGGIQLLIPIETHITCDFPEGFGPPVPPPSGSALASTVHVLLKLGPLCFISCFTSQ